ncbi:hypothetical protein [Phenylobacterium koreense]|uniref:DUF1508 domain-containing protein n=1 Tax=Phenylobacterium koreense TaxID=266125 RepID=A0ABV2ENG0_9CAUL
MISADFAYSLAQDELGWRWRVYDEDGEIVAAGRRKTQDAAELAVRQAINTVLCSTSAAPSAQPVAREEWGEALAARWNPAPLA